MSGIKSARSLRLERLEGRSLLAGGVMELSIDFEASDSLQQQDRFENAPLESREADREQGPGHRRPSDPRPSDQHSLDLRSLDVGDIQRPKPPNQKPLGPRPNGPRTNGPRESGTQNLASPLSTPPTTSPLSAANNLSDSLVPFVQDRGLGDNRSSNTNLGIGEQGLNSQGANGRLAGDVGPLDQVQTNGNSLVANRPAGAVDAAIAALASEANGEQGDATSSTDPAGEGSANEVTAEDVSALNVIDASGDSVAAVEAIALAVQQEASDELTVASDDAIVDEALMDAVWLEPFAASSDERTNRGAEPWKLDQASIALLRQILERTVVERVSTTDSVALSWFDGPGGLVALDHVELPSIGLPIAAANVEVGLESTVALHRSVHLAAEVVNPALSGSMLEAIMATLDGVAMTEQPPLMTVSQLRVPVAAYPAIAVAATTLAISNRRKHRLPTSNLQFTK